MKVLFTLWPDPRVWVKGLIYPLLLVLLLASCSSNSIIHKSKIHPTPTKETNMIVADRIAPVEIEPIEIHGVRYSQTTQPGDLESGYLEAKEVASGKILWVKRVYDPGYNEDLERDVQEVYFSEMKLSEDKTHLTIKNESNEIWRVDLKTGNSTLVSKPDESLEFEPDVE